MTEHLSRKRVLVTGGTGTIGSAVIARFARQGDCEITFQYNKGHDRARALNREFGAVAYAVDFLENVDLPRIDFDILINAAGINLTDAPTHEVSAQIWDATLTVNLTALVRISQMILPHMMQRKWGRIVNISSIYGLRARAGRLAYNVSKHGLRAITATIAREYAPMGITCNEICPGPLESELLKVAILRRSAARGEDAQAVRDWYRASIPSNELGDPVQLAELVCFLCSEQAAHINGVSIPWDGGELT
jgi:NAD(P)-dependent dehydrogenase (short-subunit alcohol dehydrogenase family)